RVFWLACARICQRDPIQPYRHRLAPPSFYSARVSQTTGRLWRSRIVVAFQASHIFRANRNSEMARANLRHAAFQLVSWSSDYLSLNFRRWILPIDLSHSALVGGSLSYQ